MFTWAACHFWHRNFKKRSAPEVFCTFWLANVLLATPGCNFSTSQLQKVVRECCVLYILPWKCASRYSGVQFFHIATSKSGPRMLCFVHFDLQTCFALACNFSTSQLQKVVRPWGVVVYILTSKCASRYSGVHFFHIAKSKSGPSKLCFVHFDLQMCFSLQRRAIFWHRNFKKVVRSWGVLYILTSKCASRYSGVQFFHIATSKSGPLLRCFVHFYFKMCFSLQQRAIFHFAAQQLPPHPPLYRGYFSTQPTHKSLKNTAFRDFPNISRLLIFFLLTFAQLYLLSSDLTSLLCFSSSFSASLLRFSTVHIVGS